jgi:hypothetical protein
MAENIQDKPTSANDQNPAEGLVFSSADTATLVTEVAVNEPELYRKSTMLGPMMVFSNIIGVNTYIWDITL